jgi:hypothetical protein
MVRFVKAGAVIFLHFGQMTLHRFILTPVKVVLTAVDGQ